MLIYKIRDAYREGGIGEVGWRGFSYFYKRLLRPVLPICEPILYSEIIVGFRRIGDELLPKLHKAPSVIDIPDYEKGLIVALKANVKKGDKVVVVGGGLGVTTAVAAIAATDSGHVTCFEGDMRGVKSIRRVANSNKVAKRVSVRYAIVGDDIDVWGSEKSQIAISPWELPTCDVLELDCEGTESGILRDMIISPRVIAVETHGHLGSPSNEIRKVLQQRGYMVTDFGLAEPRLETFCAEHDIRVLVGKRREIQLELKCRDHSSKVKPELGAK